MTSKTLPLIETAISWQGEGKFQGELCAFMRFKNCNLRCPFCDTLNRMDNLPEIEYSYEKLYDMIVTANNNMLITGGEPTMYNDQIVDFIKYVNERSTKENRTIKTNFETNGYKLVELDNKLKNINWKDYDKCYYDFSPKNFHNDKARKETLRVIKEMHHLDPHFYIKLVGYDFKDNHKYLRKTLTEIRKDFPNLCIYLMPEGAISTEIMFNTRALLQVADEFNCNFSSRLHIVHNFY